MFKLRSLVLFLCLLLMAAVPLLAQDAPPTTVTVGTSDMGNILVGPNGMTLYTFTRDTLGMSNCYERCAEIWPPLVVRSADQVTAGEGIPGELGTIERTTGTIQVTYNGMPLYYWYEDYEAGDTNGQGVGNVWWVASPATVYSQNVGELGSVLVGPTGNTLYIFTNDQPGVTNCTGDCLTNWPPLTVESEDELVAGNLPGELGTIETADGSLQVTYNGWPLYYFAEDTARGDAMGQGRGERWWVVNPVTLSASRNEELGQFLVGSNGMTVYSFANDEAGVSNCSGDCATAWPPVTVPFPELVGAAANVTGELGTIEREDGTYQVTYNGMPLYYWQDDQAPGDTTGNGVGDVWSVVAP
jgi:predicted lipoprotein with Yx(FWY)xxD motif